MPSFRTLRWLTRRGISRRRLRGGRLHRLFGERLFSRGVWKWERDSVARGWVVGAVAGSFPMPGIQWLLGVPVALLIRANLAVVIGLICATNPLTIVFYYPFCLVIGSRLTGRSIPKLDWDELRNLSAREAGVDVVVSLLVGTMAVGTIIGLLGYAGTFLFWPKTRTTSLP